MAPHHHVAVDPQLVPVGANLLVGPGPVRQRVRAHLLGFVRKERVELAVALVAADGNENAALGADGDHLGLAPGHGPLDLELRALGQQVAAQTEDGRIGAGGHGIASVAPQDLVKLPAGALQVAGAEAGACHRGDGKGPLAGPGLAVDGHGNGD